MINIMVADDHTMFVDGIDSILNKEDDMQVICKCYTGEEVLKQLKVVQPDIILLDINLPGITGIEVSKTVLAEYPEVKILAISMFNEESFVTEILNNGAQGYILKNTGRKELLDAIRTICGGKTYFSKDVTNTIMKSLMKKRMESKGSTKLIPKVSRREKEVLKLIVEEFTTQEIAKELFISLKTVESHRSSLLNKLNARNTAGLVRITMENKILEN